jgi:predicted site-specific integrase-resolvase
MTPKLVSLKQWAGLYQLTYLTAWKYASTGKIETVRHGRKYLAVIRDPAVLEILAAQEATDV